MVNSDAAPNKVGVDPLTGYIANIPVSGDFRDAYNLMTVIAGNPNLTLNTDPDLAPVSSMSRQPSYLQQQTWIRPS
jgi:hypothetical protein